MSHAGIIILESNQLRREAVSETVLGLQCHAVVSGSFADAVERTAQTDVNAIIADWESLAGRQGDNADALSIRNRLRSAIMRLRAAHVAYSCNVARAMPPHLRIIVLGGGSDNKVHAAAVAAGADAYLESDVAVDPGVLESYLVKFFDDAWRVPEVRAVREHAVETEEPARDATADESPESSPVPLVDTFGLRDEDLRDAASGRWNARQIAEVLNVDLTEIAKAIGVKYSTLAKTPASETVQEKLAPFANVVAIARDALGGDDDSRMLKWLHQAQTGLGGRTALSAMLVPSKARAVEQWVSRAWMGDPA